MRDIPQLKKDFALYLEEIDRCIEHKCYWALIHILLIIPHVCSSLEKETKPGGSGDQYVAWCNENYPKSNTISGKDLYQLRNALLHSGSTTADNRGNTNKTDYENFSLVVDEIETQIHRSASANGKILNLQPLALADETIKAIYHWFNVLQNDKVKMEHLEKNINKLANKKLKIFHGEKDNGTAFTINLTANSST